MARKPLGEILKSGQIPRDTIREYYKDVLIPAGRDDLLIQLELLMDIRELLGKMWKKMDMDDQKRSLRKARRMVKLRKI